jgi:hypothetical protein
MKHSLTHWLEGGRKESFLEDDLKNKEVLKNGSRQTQKRNKNHPELEKLMLCRTA